MSKLFFVFLLLICLSGFVFSANCSQEAGIVVGMDCNIVIGSVYCKSFGDCNAFVSLWNPDYEKVWDRNEMVFSSDLNLFWFNTGSNPSVLDRSGVWLVGFDVNFVEADFNESVYQFFVSDVNKWGYLQDINALVSDANMVGWDVNAFLNLIDVNVGDIKTLLQGIDLNLIDVNLLVWGLDQNLIDVNVLLNAIDVNLADLNVFLFDLFLDWNSLLWEFDVNKLLNVEMETTTYWYSGNTVKVVLRATDGRGKPVDLNGVSFFLYDGARNLVSGSLSTNHLEVGYYYFEYVLGSVSGQLYEVVASIDTNWGWDGNYTKVFRVSQATAFGFSINAFDVVSPENELKIDLTAINEGDVPVEVEFTCWIDVDGAQYSEKKWNKEIQQNETYQIRKELLFPVDFPPNEYLAKCRLRTPSNPLAEAYATDTFSYIAGGLPTGTETNVGDLSVLGALLAQNQYLLLIIITFLGLILIVLIYYSQK